MTDQMSKGQKQRKGLVYRQSIKENNLQALAGESYVKANVASEGSGQNHTILKGRINSRDCYSRLNVHVADSVEVRDYTARAFLQPAVTFSVILKGRVEVTMGGQPFVLDASEQPRGYLWAMKDPMLWTRKIKKDMYVRKVNISVQCDWLLGQMNANPTDDVLNRYLYDLLEKPLSLHEWHPSKRAIALAEQIVQPSSTFTLLDQFHTESRALEVICESLDCIMNQSCQGDPVELISKAQSVRDYIEDNLDADLTLNRISRQVGMAINTMQRAFKATYNMTVMDYIRERRLEVAKTAMVHDGVTIAQAAYMAGYNSPANFATAFKRVYGISPSSLKH